MVKRAIGQPGRALANDWTRNSSTQEFIERLVAQARDCMRRGVDHGTNGARGGAEAGEHAPKQVA